MTKILLLLVSAFLFSNHGLRAEDKAHKPLPIRPSDRQATTVTKDKNPYQRRSSSDRITIFNEDQDQRFISKLIEANPALKSRGSKEIKLLICDHVVRKNLIIHQLHNRQSKPVRVNEITTEELTLEWLDPKTEQPTGRTFTVSYEVAKPDPMLHYLRGSRSQ